MKRLWRWLFNFAAALSLMMCAATAVLWVRSYRNLNSLGNADSFTITRDDPRYWLLSKPGQLVLCRQVGKDWPAPLSAFQFIGIVFGGQRGPNSLLWNLGVPYWLILCISLLLAAPRLGMWFNARRQRARIQVGHCASCGYDLRATPDRCPECGASAQSMQS